MLVRDTYIDVLHRNTYPIPFLLIRVRFCPEFLDVQKQAYAVPDLVDTHLLQYSLIHLQQVLAIDVVLSKQFLVFSAVDTD